eukprot:CAMPEP_0113424352 /NCGR_PEP_ID=MMETSP0013_2-20120614/29544_1 /TAXON_ID=2843 ORGANISM="Skeletonema costatum, Strain 1716" /NCGR_SAMPLE_ID=MMETSP0013_2 /ASSEMBLY_ACC=CAM_ASM_000158 /LENGTH=265 /DNA_ID=CAMNT_0000312349 /DNA_START=62 /DNA_END=856 /DNA_ORIENTATION=+ /assembly_acc=CAM_ASM_000158
MPDATKNATTSPSTTKPDNQSTTIIGSSSSENIGTTTTIINNDNNNNNETDGDDMLLVTEFPPPPYYYTLASHNKLTPPEIPHRAFRVAAKRVRQEKERARLESERIRLEAEVKDDSGDGDVGSGDVEDKSKDVVMTTTTDNQQQQQQDDNNNNNNDDDDDDDSITDPNNPNEPIVAVFGEIVEDPTLLLHTDQEDCNNPTILRDNVKRLNRSVLQGFLKLVSKLVHDPIENKSSRDELSHDIFLMLQECNKFREHQAREILIET